MTTPIMTVSRTWRTKFNEWIPRDGNVAAGDTTDANDAKKRVMLHIKNQFTTLGANPWVVTKSFGFVSGLNLSGDNWASIADLRFQTSKTNRPWLVMYCAPMNIEILFDCTGIVGQRGCRADFYVSRSTSGTSFTGGSSSARPTSTTEILCLGSTDGSGFGNWGVGGTSTAVRDFVVHVWHDDAGEGSRAVIQFNDEVRGFWILDKLVDNQAGLVNPWTVVFRQADITDTPDTALRAHYFESDRLMVGDQSDVLSIAFMGTGLRAPAAVSSPPTNMGFSRSTFDSSIPGGKIGVVSTFDPVGYRGTIPDIWLGPGTKATGPVIKTGNTMNLYRNKELVSIGDFILPWDGVSDVTFSTV